MSYLKGLVVDKYKSVDLGVVDTTISNSSHLSDFDLDSISKIVLDLNNVISNPNGALLWGQEQIMIDSDPINSKCEDEMNGEILPDVQTSSLLNLMIEIKNFKAQYQNPTNLRNIVGQAFTNIKSNPNNYKRFPNSDFYFATTINAIYITLVLEPEDLNLTEREYVNQLNTNF